MLLWIQWWRIVRQLRPAFARETTFLWFALCLVGLTVRHDLRGVTSLIRAVGLKEVSYDRPIFIGDGIKLAKTGRKMPAGKRKRGRRF